MSDWLSMGGYARFVWPSFGVFLLSVLGGWAWAAWRGHRIRQQIREYLKRQDTEAA